MSFFSEVTTNEKFIPNIIILFEGVYFRLRNTDDNFSMGASGLGLVSSLTISPTSIDPFRPTTTISTYSFSLLDKDRIVSQLYANNAKRLQGAPVEIWLGRSGVDMPFSDYYKLPNTFVAKLSKDASRYNFQSEELRDRLPKSSFNKTTKLSSDIVPSSTVIPCGENLFPSSGLVRIGKEIVFYTAKSGNNLIGLFRGTEGTDTLDHEAGETVEFITKLEGNALTLLLKILISQGGGGTYDVLDQGAGIDPSLINVARIESIRDSLFSGAQWDFLLYAGGIEDIKKYVSEEILYPLSVRFRSDANKISLAVLDRAFFDVDAPVLDHSAILKQPTYEVDDNLIRNRLRISWGWSESKQTYLLQSEYSDADSLAAFGEQTVTELKFKGTQSSTVIDEISALFFSRFSVPRPVITANTKMKSFFSNLGDKVTLETNTLPNDQGELAFAEDLEVISQAINVATGDIRFGLSFNSYTGVRACFIAPSDRIVSFSSQKILTVGAGRGEQYRVGWKMRLYDDVTRDLVTPDQINTIAKITGDVLEFENNWTQTLDVFKRIQFADYNDVTEQQKKFCFISDGGLPFDDGKPSYQITF